MQHRQHLQPDGHGRLGDRKRQDLHRPRAARRDHAVRFRGADRRADLLRKGRNWHPDLPNQATADLGVWGHRNACHLASTSTHRGADDCPDANEPSKRTAEAVARHWREAGGEVSIVGSTPIRPGSTRPAAIPGASTRAKGAR